MTWLIVKIVQKFRSPRVVSALPWRGAQDLRLLKTLTSGAYACKLFSNLIRIFQDISKNLPKLRHPHKISIYNFYKNSRKFPKFLFQKLTNHSLRDKNSKRLHRVKLLRSIGDGKGNKCYRQS